MPARRWLPRSTSVQIAIISFLALLVSFAVLITFIARLTQNQLDSNGRDLIRTDQHAITAVFSRDGPNGAASFIAGEIRAAGPLVILLSNAKGRVEAGNMVRWPAGLGINGGFRRQGLMRVGHATSEKFLVLTSRLPGDYRLLVGRSIEEQERLSATLASSLIAAVGLAFIMAFAVSLLLTRIINLRVQGIAGVAAAVAGGDIGRRVDVPTQSAGDAFDKLGHALNDMLARIELLLNELRSVTDGLAHDLRSPLTRMKARIDRLSRSDTGLGTEISAIGHEADALLAMLEANLEISRLEAGIGRDGFSQVDLAGLVVDMVEMYAPLAEDNGVALVAVATGPVPILAHRGFLGRALSNLIDNALRYGAGGGRITVTAEATPDGARLAVADRGPGIDQAKRELALRRFGRLDVARPAGGAGLGLSLAAAIARLHGGSLALAGNDPGLKVIIDLPNAHAATFVDLTNTI